MNQKMNKSVQVDVFSNLYLIKFHTYLSSYTRITATSHAFLLRPFYQLLTIESYQYTRWPIVCCLQNYISSL